ncbi:hypothetical protein ASJ83_03245 [Methanocorpusculum parvum]|uniref:Uncharacterized protein n=1 Tax=Methanocorpusculum parvum TaxID=2193 RepID=A0AAX0Q789_9EURY|nr:hypothetical protein ASJ83_03245 [Methanocorpusculum parvum]
MSFAHLRRHASLRLARLRESSRIAFSLRSGALLRLIAYAESHPLLKNAIRKTRVRVFLLFHYFLLAQKEKLTERKTGTPVFLIAFVQEPKALETSHELSARGLFQTACDSA